MDYCEWPDCGEQPENVHSYYCLKHKQRRQSLIDNLKLGSSIEDRKILSAVIYLDSRIDEIEKKIEQIPTCDCETCVRRRDY